MLFGSVSGSAIAAAAAVGTTMAPMQAREGYDKAFTAATNVASAPSGMLIPPSNLLIIYALASGGTSVGALFIAGYVPGILWGVACMAVVWFYARKHPELRAPRAGDGLASWAATFVQALPSLTLVVVVIGGIIGGFFTATEAVRDRGRLRARCWRSSTGRSRSRTCRASCTPRPAPAPW